MSVFIFLIYFATRFINLLKLPIFNDESIYLHWGQIMINFPGYAFYSLFDGKPPLILWILGFSQKLPINPLVAGRSVSIIFGFLTLLGIKKTCQILKFSQKTQIIAGLLYIFNPLTLFFDRLALLESPISTIFIWIIYFSLKFNLQLDSTWKEAKPFLILGLIQGIGLWIKGTAKFFLFLPFIIPLLTLIIDKNQKQAIKEGIVLFGSFLLAKILFLPIRLNPLFSLFQKREADFLLPFPQTLNPLLWFSHILFLSLTLLILITPFVLFFCLLGFFKFFRQDKKSALILFSFPALPIIFEIFFTRFFLSRYFLFAILPIFIFAAYGLENIKFQKKFFLFLTMVLPFSLCLFLIFNPFLTLKTLSENKIIAQDLNQYFTGWTSGYGVKEAADFLDQKSKDGPIIIFLRADSGNPEDGIFTYLSKNKNIIFVQATQKPKPEELKSLAKFPIYFLSRGHQFLDMENWLSEIKIFKKPEDKEFVGIYKIILDKESFNP